MQKGIVKGLLRSVASTMNNIETYAHGPSKSSSTHSRGSYLFRLGSDSLRLVAKDPNRQKFFLASMALGAFASANGVSTPLSGLGLGAFLGYLPALRAAKKWNGKFLSFESGYADSLAKMSPVPLGVGTKLNEDSDKNWNVRNSEIAAKEKHRKEQGIVEPLIQNVFNGKYYQQIKRRHERRKTNAMFDRIVRKHLRKRDSTKRK